MSKRLTADVQQLREQVALLWDEVDKLKAKRKPGRPPKEKPAEIQTVSEAN